MWKSSCTGTNGHRERDRQIMNVFFDLNNSWTVLVIYDKKGNLLMIDHG